MFIIHLFVNRTLWHRFPLVQLKYYNQIKVNRELSREMRGDSLSLVSLKKTLWLLVLQLLSLLCWHGCKIVTWISLVQFTACLSL